MASAFASPVIGRRRLIVCFETTSLVGVVDVVAFLAACLAPALVPSGHFGSVELGTFALGVFCNFAFSWTRLL